tara:strand:+ start:10814 stop:12712 length:1899 start_codon:yes stop_codon:yes gene_type:complete
MFLNYLIKNLSDFKPIYRRIILVIIDILVIILAVNLNHFLFPNENFDDGNYLNIISIFLVFTTLSIYFITGNYRSLTKYVGSKYFYNLIIKNFFAGLLTFLILSIFLDRRFFYLFPSMTIVSNVLLGFVKVLLRDLLIYSLKIKKFYKKKIVIYGAGEAGAQLNASLRFQGNYDVKFFIDDDKNLWSRNLDGICIHPISFLIKNNKDIDQIFLAIPSLDKRRRLEILSKLESIGISILQIPSLSELSSNKIDHDILRPIYLEDLLGREPIKPNLALMKKAIKDKVIFVTGAGGSIGSELSRQICILEPKKVILLEQNELSLYNLTNSLKDDYGEILIPKLGDAKNLKYLSDLFIEYEVDVVFHAAAYKHVPLVEDNFMQSMINNIFSTKAVCEASLFNKVELMMLISSDKAVRPTNIMGVSKRISELIVHAYSKKSKNNLQNHKLKTTFFSMVRFGNVLGSSGSVLPLFQKQISLGGPVTITHPKIVRYFMTVLEATQLVIHSAAMASGGDVFLLDMGEEVKIIDFAKQLIRLNGFSVKDNKNPKGDIEIITSGLRPGEKLYEELLIDETALRTSHPRIFKAIQNNFKDIKIVFNILEELEESLNNNKSKESLKLLSKLVPEWKPYRKSYLE